MQNIRFFDNDRKPSLRERKRLKDFLIGLLKTEKTTLITLTYIFCSDKYLQSINNEFLKHDYYTDIITFNLGSKIEVIGEVYISTDRVRENAEKLGVTFTNELHRVIIHGALHLCGYKDKRSYEIVKMRKREDFYLFKYFKKET